MTTTLPSNEIAIRSSLPAIVASYKRATREIRAAYRLLTSAEQRLKHDFNDQYQLSLNRDEIRRIDYDHPEEAIAILKKAAWRTLIEKMELRRFMSQKRSDELDRQLETGDGLPEIEEDQILATMKFNLENINGYIEEAIREVYAWLRPRKDGGYKTNSPYQVGKRVIVRRVVENRYGGGFHVNYHYQQNLRSLDNVFHVLDGHGTVKDHYGQLIPAIDASDTGGRGETDYFRIHCHRNTNLHIEFKRIDLLEKFNAIAGGGMLKPGLQPAN